MFFFQLYSLPALVTLVKSTGEARTGEIQATTAGIILIPSPLIELCVIKNEHHKSTLKRGDFQFAADMVQGRRCPPVCPTIVPERLKS